MLWLGRGREPTRDGFLRHPMPRRLLSRRPWRMSRAIGTRMCRLAALGEAIKVEEFLVGFSPHYPQYGREGVQDRHFYLLLVAETKNVDSEHII
ncbi:hypothetical protein EVAR_25769_1 [Eumeta japonica]|uniref:Uncharacterized protein n=1 Tax=Eumeta variegata TaxID=151549 RepID=A0A4C1ZZT8_EUMVA|nr:hypothetical protein EVAR_25769_1 [Eumeta japonica]